VAACHTQLPIRSACRAGKCLRGSRCTLRIHRKAWDRCRCTRRNPRQSVPSSRGPAWPFVRRFCRGSAFLFLSACRGTSRVLVSRRCYYNSINIIKSQCYLRKILSIWAIRVSKSPDIRVNGAPAFSNR
jgi:hypothetical protein